MFKKKCDVRGCEKEIEGYSEKQVTYLMKQHHLSKHEIKDEEGQDGSS